MPSVVWVLRGFFVNHFYGLAMSQYMRTSLAAITSPWQARGEGSLETYFRREKATGRQRGAGVHHNRARGAEEGAPPRFNSIAMNGRIETCKTRDGAVKTAQIKTRLFRLSSTRSAGAVTGLRRGPRARALASRVSRVERGAALHDL